MSLKSYLKKMISKPTQSSEEKTAIEVEPSNLVNTSYGRVTHQQHCCIEYRPEGKLLVRGIPGSGKSTVLLARAQYLANKTKDLSWNGEKVLVLSYNRALATYMRYLCKKSGSPEIETATFHQWGLQLLGDLGHPITVCVDNKTKRDKIIYAYNIIKKNNKDAKFPKMGADSDKADFNSMIKFLEEEFSWMKGLCLTQRNQYVDAPRSGRGTKVQVTKIHKQSIFDVYEKYNELLTNMRKIDFDDVGLILLQFKDRIPMEKRPLHILVDEAQDLSLVQLQVLSQLAVESLTIAADKGQQIYRRNFSWRAAGIDIHKGNSKFLTYSFRSTKQINALARSLQQHDVLLKKDDEYVTSDDPIAEGPIPELIQSNTLTHELEILIRKITQLSAQFPNDSIGLIATRQKRLEQMADALKAAGLPYVFAKEDQADIISPGIKLISIHSSKGLEFDHVIVSGLKEGVLPYKKTDPDEDEEEFLTRERRKLYVAMTRGKLTLTLSSVQKPSRFLEELDSSLYNII